MGASWFQITGSGRSLRSTYDTLTEAAILEEGNDSYNGTISTTHGVNDLTAQYKRSGKKLNDFINDQVDRLEKRQCAAICIEAPKENTNKIKTSVQHIVTPGTKKWVLTYEVETYFEGEVVARSSTKTEALIYARTYTEKHQRKTRIVMRKRLANVDSTVAIIDYKKSTSEKPGRWVFFGYAAE